MALINIGHGSYVDDTRIITVAAFGSMPIKRIVQNARDTNKLIDCTFGRKTRSAIIMDSDHIVLSFKHPDVIIPVEKRKGYDASDRNKE